MSQIEPGWYKDPAEPTTQRYWDGEQWIGQSLPIGATPPRGPLSPRASRRAARSDAAGTVTAPRDSRPAAPTRTRRTRRPATPQSPAASDSGAGAPANYQPSVHEPAGPSAPAPQGQGWPPAPQGQGWPPAPQGQGWPPGQPGPGWPARPHGYPVAPLGLRLLARLIDIAVLTVLCLLANGYLIYQLWGEVKPYLTAAIQASQTGGQAPALPSRANTLILLIELILVLLWFVYEVPATAGRGQTLGKRIMGIKVMALEGTQPLGMGRAWRRWNPLALPVLLWTCLLVGFLLQLIDSVSPALGGPLRLALHDRSAGTVVVRTAGVQPDADARPPIPPRTGGPP